jgi:hypothetical protein
MQIPIIVNRRVSVVEISQNDINECIRDLNEKSGDDENAPVSLADVIEHAEETNMIELPDGWRLHPNETDTMVTICD